MTTVIIRWFQSGEPFGNHRVERHRLMDNADEDGEDGEYAAYDDESFHNSMIILCIMAELLEVYFYSMGLNLIGRCYPMR